MNMGTKIGRRLFQGSFLGLCMAVFLPQTVHADFSGYYAPANWLLTNTDADGFVDTSGAPMSIQLFGGNDLSGNPGTTDFTIAAQGSGIVSFDYLYASRDAPGFDSAGILLNGLYITLATVNDATGSAAFPVVAGDIFGFRVSTMDNTEGSADFTISNFSAPVPEPATWLMIVAGGTLLVALRYRRFR